MAVTLDVERTWRVHCDHNGCGRRLYLIAEALGDAAVRAVTEFGWDVSYSADEIHVRCREHKEVSPGR